MISDHLFFYSVLIISTCFAVGVESLIGGDKAKVNEFPYQVSVQDDGIGHTCGGGIIDDYFILTAAHCIVNLDGQFFGRQVIVIAGTIDLNRKPAVIVKVAKMYIPTEFTISSVNTTGDIAVLKLNESLKLSENKLLERLRLPKNKYESYMDETAMIAGFGKNSVKVVDHQEIYGYTDNQLRYSKADIINSTHCQMSYLHLQGIFKKHLCAKVEQRDSIRRSTCIGDSGGPLVDDGKVIGILSKGPHNCKERIQPAIYTRVSYYLTFITNAKKNVETKNIRSYTQSDHTQNYF